MFRMIKRLGCYACLMIGGGLALTLHAEEKQNPDWPCAQVLVPEISAAVVWDGPPIAGLEQAWERDKEVEVLVRRLVSPDYEMGAVDGEIADFSSQQNPSVKDRKLTLLFAGVIQSLNERRKKELDGIMRYARGQAERANRLSEELDEMINLQSDASQAAQARLALMQKEMEIKQRMFDEREAFMQHLCTRPMVIEEKLGSLARAIAYYLD